MAARQRQSKTDLRSPPPRSRTGKQQPARRSGWKQADGGGPRRWAAQARAGGRGERRRGLCAGLEGVGRRGAGGGHSRTEGRDRGSVGTGPARPPSDPERSALKLAMALSRARGTGGRKPSGWSGVLVSLRAAVPSSRAALPRRPGPRARPCPARSPGLPRRSPGAVASVKLQRHGWSPQRFPGSAIALSQNSARRMSFKRVHLREAKRYF